MLLIQLLLVGQLDIIALMSGAVLTTIKEACSLLFWVLIIRAILSWFSQGRNPMELVLVQLTEPLLRPVRKVVPAMGGLDLSLLVVLLGIQFIQILLTNMLRGF